MNKKQLIYIAAASHSGSTLLAMLLASHPRLTTIGELKAIHLADKAEYLCSCQTRLLDCPHWQKIHDIAHQQIPDFDVFSANTDLREGASPYIKRLLKPLVRGKYQEWVRDKLLHCSPMWQRHLAQNQYRNHVFIDAVLKASNAQAVIDSSKIGIRLKYLLKNPALDIKVIWLVRDGRGVSLAYQSPSEFADAKRQEHKGGGTGRTQEQGRDIAKGAHEWKRCNQEIAHVVADLPKDKVFKLSYERYCQNPQAALEQLAPFLGVDASGFNMRFKDVPHHVIGNGMRLDDDDTIALDERWKDTLKAKELSRYFDVVGPFHEQMGYSRVEI